MATLYVLIKYLNKVCEYIYITSVLTWDDNIGSIISYFKINSTHVATTIEIISIVVKNAFKKLTPVVSTVGINEINVSIVV